MPGTRPMSVLSVWILQSRQGCLNRPIFGYASPSIKGGSSEVLGISLYREDNMIFQILLIGLLANGVAPERWV